MTVATESEVPAQGQLVTVRNRQWVVADVQRGSVASSDPFTLTGEPQHLVTLVSIEDDARDEELRVVWELEYGAVIYDRALLPGPADGFDDPKELDAFLDAVRWGAIASADRTALQAPFRSGIQIEDYQLDPVVRALSMPRTNLLIADDVGLGKTIEAGLVMQELMLRHRARTMIIVCPAGLTVQWRDEMRDKFGLDFRIVDTALLKRLRRERGLYANPWTHYPRLIVSIDWLKRDRPLRLLRDVLPGVPRYPRTFDLLVVDEVHTCAPSGTGRYAVDSLRTQAIRQLAPHCEHRLFLSATPHNGYLESFTALLELLDDQRFARGVKPAPEQLKRVMVRRLKRELPPKWNGDPAFPMRRLDYLEVDHSEDERRMHELLTSYAESRRARAGGGSGVAAADFVIMLLKKRLFSSPKAFAETIDTHLATMNARDHASDEHDRAVARAGARVLRPLAERLAETAEDDTAYRDVETDALTAVRRISPPLTAEERATLEELRTLARRAADRPDAKVKALREWLEPIVCPDGPRGEWTRERVIIFTEYRDTQRWLHERLHQAGYPPERIKLLYGGQDTAEREHVKNVFQESPDLPGGEVRILLATDAASEGINLQNHCHRLLHWEIPWNPNRLEQRNGRVDRHGQRASRVDVLHFVPRGWEGAGFGDGSLEDEMLFLQTTARKVEQIREDLGGAGEVIAAQVERKMLGRRADWAGVDVEIARRSANARLKVERDLARDLERLTGALAGSRTELNLFPETIERVVRTGLRLAHRKDLDDADPPEGFPARCFRLPELPGAWAQARNDGLHHPLTGAERPVTFDQDAAAGRTDVVLLHLGHRLVQMCLRLLRAELWAGATGHSARLHRVTARLVPGDVLRTPAVVAHGRVVITGAEGTRLHEEIIVAGGLIKGIEGDEFTRAKETDVEHWLSAASEEPVPEAVRRQLAEVWDKIGEPLGKALRARARQRARSLERLIAQRADEEVEAMQAVLTELERSIGSALDDVGRWEQGSLFESDDQRTQLRKDRDALAERLRAIPEQREHEAAVLRRRYADPTDRWFPAAVTFLVPAALAHQAGGAR
ncbi:Helicase conserved C-terminal domain-containing protein [Thermomonospora echinospora]|uniref:Helicase conserved C-terminal domain-containing protein n=1 Tax=Thermomonospora echinospora TaxID=1992 RepID=A0A1H5T751_9ACTN|nr:DISARM system SNF2-like helicase DrmD [Thermomonospora echinospora]SEF57817.1 Helicase conserved C-terminal domain-containing protein [Thermomonospora echinospora]